MSDVTCKDCGVVLDEETLTHVEPSVEEHAGLCCDCYDEKFGMPAENRTRPRAT